MKHTPTPWEIWTNPDKRTELRAITAPKHTDWFVAQDISEQDAQFIVTACNAHDKLVEALEFCRQGFASLPHSYGYDITHIKKIDLLLEELKE